MHRASLRAFAFARGDEVAEHAVEQRQRFGLQRLGIAGAGLQHAGELQQSVNPMLQRRETRADRSQREFRQLRDQRADRAAAHRRLPARAGAG